MGWRTTARACAVRVCVQPWHALVWRRTACHGAGVVCPVALAGCSVMLRASRGGGERGEVGLVVCVEGCVFTRGWFVVRVCAAAGVWQSVLVLVWSCVRGWLDCRWCCLRGCAHCGYFIRVRFLDFQICRSGWFCVLRAYTLGCIVVRACAAACAWQSVLVCEAGWWRRWEVP